MGNGPGINGRQAGWLYIGSVVCLVMCLWQCKRSGGDYRRSNALDGADALRQNLRYRNQYDYADDGHEGPLDDVGPTV